MRTTRTDPAAPEPQPEREPARGYQLVIVVDAATRLPVASWLVPHRQRESTEGQR